MLSGHRTDIHDVNDTCAPGHEPNLIVDRRYNLHVRLNVIGSTRSKIAGTGASYGLSIILTLRNSSTLAESSGLTTIVVTGVSMMAGPATSMPGRILSKS